MKLPDADQAVVAREKITDYLLSLTSPRGASKARFFRQFGFQVAEWEVFAAALRSHCQQHEVAATLETEYGIQYVIIGRIETPDGRNPNIRAVWQVDNGADYPRFITARPAH